ncbi:MAG TPA: hypothetical protein ENN68_02605 [Methanomicrobia archaeon]|nr:hypothetical protein [Methanomicrobia archaeon]
MTVVTHKMLRDKLRKGRIRGNWRVLDENEKALYRVALAYTKPKRRTARVNGRRQEIEIGRTIVQTLLVQKLLELFEKLLETRGMKIFKRGFAKAVELQQRCGTVVWASSLPQWLKDPDFIFWLGAMRRGT